MITLKIQFCGFLNRRPKKTRISYSQISCETTSKKVCLGNEVEQNGQIRDNYLKKVGSDSFTLHEEVRPVKELITALRRISRPFNLSEKAKGRVKRPQPTRGADPDTLTPLPILRYTTSGL